MTAISNESRTLVALAAAAIALVMFPARGNARPRYPGSGRPVPDGATGGR